VKVAWWPHTTDVRVASFRLRCQQIVERLARQGHAASLYDRNAPAPDVLVLSKRYDAASLAQAQRLANEHGTRLILDLCDNHFHHAPGSTEPLARRAAELRAAVVAVDMVTTASQALAQTVRLECPSVRHVCVVDDAVEPPYEPAWLAKLAEPRAEARLQAMRRWLQQLPQVPRSRRLVWFGNHGSPGVEAGLSDLERLRTLLERHAANSPMTLTIISNNAAKAAQLTQDWTLPTHYLEWHAATFSRALAEHSAAIVPISPNPFTLCKTANRVLTSFVHGLNVIADSIPSYAPFASCVVLDDWEFGVGRYLETPERRRADIEQGSALARERYGLDRIAGQWVAAAKTALTLPKEAAVHSAK
jgi:hypothetical protein